MRPEASYSSCVVPRPHLRCRRGRAPRPSQRQRQAWPHAKVPEAAREDRPAPARAAARRHADARRRASAEQPLRSAFRKRRVRHHARQGGEERLYGQYVQGPMNRCPQLLHFNGSGVFGKPRSIKVITEYGRSRRLLKRHRSNATSALPHFAHCRALVFSAIPERAVSDMIPSPRTSVYRNHLGLHSG